VASQDIGPLGPKDGPPVAFDWPWYYHVPMLPLWLLLLLLLIVPKTNRKGQAWLILIPLCMVILVWRMPMRLLSVSDGAMETTGFFIETLALAWTMVWLAADWLAGHLRRMALLRIAAVMTLACLLSYVCYYSCYDDILNPILGFGFNIVILPLSLLWSSYGCRKIYSRGRFHFQLLLRMIVLFMLFILTFMLVLVILQYQEPEDLMNELLGMIYASLLFAVILYLLNLPFLILAHKSPFYHDRFVDLFHIEKKPVELNVPIEDG
jgi:hypothetical protein